MGSGILIININRSLKTRLAEAGGLGWISNVIINITTFIIIILVLIFIIIIIINIITSLFLIITIIIIIILVITIIIIINIISSPGLSLWQVPPSPLPSTVLFSLPLPPPFPPPPFPPFSPTFRTCTCRPSLSTGGTKGG